MIIAIYKLNDKILKTTNLEKKLKKLKQEVEIIYKQEFEGNVKEAEEILDNFIKTKFASCKDEKSDIVLHHFINRKTKHTITSIYNDVKHLESIGEYGYEQID